MNQVLTAEIIAAIVAFFVATVPATLASLYYLKQLRSRPAGQEYVAKSELTLLLDWEAKQRDALGQRLEEVERRCDQVENKFTERLEELARALTELRVEIAHLGGLLARTLGDDKG